jgi:hypothetical protein
MIVSDWSIAEITERSLICRSWLHCQAFLRNISPVVYFDLLNEANSTYTIAVDVAF